jgi:hypothetical protein
MLIKLVNGVPVSYSIGQLRQDNPQVSFPAEISNATLAEYDVYPVIETQAPPYDSDTQYAVQNVQLIGADWTQVWEVLTLPEDQAANNIRSRRNMLLQETDWMALSDNVMTPEWASYRQQLRDITSQAGFPYEVIWPIKPE